MLMRLGNLLQENETNTFKDAFELKAVMSWDCISFILRDPGSRVFSFLKIFGVVTSKNSKPFDGEIIESL